MLNQRFRLAPAIFPASEFCSPTLSHPNFHAGNIFVNNDKAMFVTGIIDWQRASLRPLFEIEIPEVVNIDNRDLEYVRLPSGELQQPILPDNFEELENLEKDMARTEARQTASKDEFLRVISQLRPDFYTKLQTPLIEPIRSAIYYSSFSWSDGLPLFEQCLGDN
jgi:hypothetical protein